MNSTIFKSALAISIVAAMMSGKIVIAENETGYSETGQSETADSKTIIGPRNIDLHDGAEALKAGDAKDGVRLTLSGLQSANGRYEQVAALSNLCAGYTMLKQYDIALAYCNQALGLNDQNWRSYSNRALIYVLVGRYAEAKTDLDIAQQISPDSRKVKAVRTMLRNAVSPVVPTIVIDDRRDSIGEPSGLATTGDEHDDVPDN